MATAQIIRCNCGRITDVCVVPDCYESKEWAMKVSKAVFDGKIMDIINAEDVVVEECICKSIKESEEKKADNQINMFE
jgi:hypothetical protein